MVIGIAQTPNAVLLLFNSFSRLEKERVSHGSVKNV